MTLFDMAPYEIDAVTKFTSFDRWRKFYELSVKQVDVLAYGFFRQSGVNPTDIAPTTSKYLIEYPDSYDQINTAKLN